MEENVPKPTGQYTQWTKQKVRGRRLVYYFSKACDALTNVRDKRIKISKFDTCNDLFELASFSCRSSVIRKKHKRWMDDVKDHFGLICFSSAWQHSLMWAHYGDMGNGTCLAYSINKDLLDKIKYVPRRLNIEKGFDFPTPDGQAKFRDFCSTKFSAWSYERESRLLCNYKNTTDVVRHVLDDKDLRFRNCDQDIKLIGIINGPKPTIGRSEFMEASGDNVEYFQCRPAFRNFHMVSQRNRGLWT